jgi:hypothetical protein
MCYEGMEESGSEGLDELIEARKNDFFSVSIYWNIRQYPRISMQSSKLFHFLLFLKRKWESVPHLR